MPEPMTAPLTRSTQDPAQDPYRVALHRHDAEVLKGMLQNLNAAEPGQRAPAMPGIIAERVGDQARTLVEQLDSSARLALSVFVLTETTWWPARGLATCVRSLGIDPFRCLLSLLDLGLLVAQPNSNVGGMTQTDRLKAAEGADAFDLIIHPAAMSSVRTCRPAGDLPRCEGNIQHIREADGLEPIARLAALWQRLLDDPARQTQQGLLYKRDRERLDADLAISGPITDVLQPLPDPVSFWLGLAHGLGLIGPEEGEEGTDRIVAVPSSYWIENAVHLPQMIATRWLGRRDWDALQGEKADERPEQSNDLPFLRPSVLLWLSTLDESEWILLEDLFHFLKQRVPNARWLPIAGAEAAPRGKRKAKQSPQAAMPSDTEAFAAMLLGPAYLLGLTRVGEEPGTGRRALQLTALGRYALALGPPPPPKAGFDQFLFVQPNFEIIAYRQGLTPSLIGRLSRYTDWVQIGAAMTLRVTTNAIYRGLESGLTASEIIDDLQGHSARPLPAGIAEAIETWASRRERLTYYASATLIEFGTAEALESTLDSWSPSDPKAPIRVSERLLLVEDESQIPFQRFRMAGARDYRRPHEACVEVQPDGVTLLLDMSRTDLFIEAELTRFAVPINHTNLENADRQTLRRFAVTPETLRRALDDGLTPNGLNRWFLERTGQPLPPALRLLLHACSETDQALQAQRPLILSVPSPDLLDGLLQYPETQACFGDRLGPTTAVVLDDQAEHLRLALAQLGLCLEWPSEGG